MSAMLTERSARNEVENEIERLIGLLDSIDPDPDLEPSLGGDDEGGRYAVDAELDTSDAEDTMGSLDSMGDQTLWASGCSGDIEEESEDEGAQCDDEGYDADREPSLGAVESGEGPQLGWDNNFSDLEQEVRVFYPRPRRIDVYTRNFLEAKEGERLARGLHAIVARKARAAKRRKALA